MVALADTLPARNSEKVVNRRAHLRVRLIGAQTRSQPLVALGVTPLRVRKRFRLTNLHRWYDPAVGRWISEDPIGFGAGDPNVFRYVGNQPTNQTDANGLRPPRRTLPPLRPPTHRTRPGSPARRHTLPPFGFRNWRQYEEFERDLMERGGRGRRPTESEVRRHRTRRMIEASQARSKLDQAIQRCREAGVPESQIQRALNEPTIGAPGRNLRAERLNRLAGEQRAGSLRNVGTDAWESSGGLRYVGRDPQGRNRVQHVLRHGEDIPDRPGRHGVFDAGRRGALGTVDEAFGIAQRGGPDVTIVVQGNRTIYTIDMGRRVGYVGGQEGAAAGNPAAHHIRLIVESGNKVISAFPVIP